MGKNKFPRTPKIGAGTVKTEGWRFLLPLFCAGTILWGGYWEFWHLPCQEAYLAAESQAYANRQKLTELEDYLARHPNLVEYRAEAERAKILSDELLPANMTESKFLRYLDNEADRQNIRLLSVLPDEMPRKGENFTALPVKITVELNYFELLDFLAELEAAPRFINVQKIKIVAAGDKLKCELTLVIYAQNTAAGVNKS